ncbi:MAG: hypothetical protein EOO06_03960 [Chitinophagaceae bacterium]|nr:MAG: hypothetical protein EOO06_03960 [Chitinophagaceae bacterium]
MTSAMEKYVFVLLLFATAITNAQDNDCVSRQMAKAGKWTKLKETVKAAPADLAVQRRFYNAVHDPLQVAYQPRGLDAAYSGSFQPAQYSQPIPYWYYTLFAERYICEGDALVLNKFDITSMFRVEFNYVSFVEIYDTAAADNPLGFRVLREGIPEEMRPGIWQFRDATTSLGAGLEGITKNWLITYDGQLPWTFVTRREFLQKRKRLLQKELAGESTRLKEKIAGWEEMKKYKEQEYKSDPAKLAAYLSGTHNPAIEREKANYQRSIAGYQNGLERLDDQLSAPADELNKRAIVIKSTQNNFDYGFTDNMVPFAELLIKPNPAYFKKYASGAVPQMITVSIRYDAKNAVMVEFAKAMEQNLRLDYLKSFIGKSAPAAVAAALPVKPQTGSNGNKAPETAVPVQKAPTSTKITKATPDKGMATEPGPKQRGNYVSGILSAPAGIAVTVGYGNNELTITPQKSKEQLYGSNPFRFTSSLKNGESFDLGIRKLPGNLKAVVYRGKGNVPEDTGKIRVGVDYKYELLSRSSDDKKFSNFYETAAPAVAGMDGEEGRYICFISWTKGFAGNDGKFRQVFWRDRNTGITKMISVAPDGSPADADCALPTISADGKKVVFESKATNLVTGDQNKAKDIFLWRASTNSIELVSKAADGGNSNGESYDAMIAGNGSYVVFTSDAVNMTSVPRGRSQYNIFLRDLPEGKTQMLSVDPVTKTGGNGIKASISFDGSRVSFCSPSNTLVANDNNNLWDIFLWEKGRGGLRRISFTQDGKERNQGDESGSRQVSSTLSGNGQYVVYSTTASNMVPGDVLKYQDVFVYDINSNQLQVASFSNNGEPGNHDSPIEQGERLAISYDGTWVAFSTKASNLGAPGSNIILYNTQTKTKQVVTDTKGSYVGRPAISYSGSYVVFGKSEALDQRSGAAFGDNGGGLFAFFTGNGPCRDCEY